MAMTFAKPQFMTWDGNRVTDHNRGEVGISVERIENANRMANGTRRSYVVADKRSFSVDWTSVPSKARYAVDGYWAADEIEDFYNKNFGGAFTLYLHYSEGPVKSYLVIVSSFSKTLKKRGLYDLYDVTVELEEV